MEVTLKSMNKNKRADTGKCFFQNVGDFNKQDLEALYLLD